MVRLHRAIGHLPMVLHGNPKDVLVVGMGGGATPGAVSQYPGAQIQIVELAEGVRQAAQFFKHVNYDLLTQPNVSVRIDDGRNFLALTDRRFDVVTADIIQPGHAGAGHVYSREYFSLVRNAMKDDGVVLQWIGHRPRLEYTLIMRFLDVFPDATLCDDANFMVGTRQSLRIDQALERLRGTRRRAALDAGLTGADVLRSWRSRAPTRCARSSAADRSHRRSPARRISSLAAPAGRPACSICRPQGRRGATCPLTRCSSTPAACCAIRPGRASPTRWCVTAPYRRGIGGGGTESHLRHRQGRGRHHGRSRARLALFQPRCITPACCRVPPPTRRSPSCGIYHHHFNLWEHVDGDVAPALAALKDRGLKLVVVSNANGRPRHLFDRVDLTKWFDHVLDSHEWGVEKPDPRLFKLALESARAAASRTVHVGDLYHVDVVGARQAGLREGVLFDMAGLYDGVDCPRVDSLAALVEWIDNPSGNQTRKRVP